MRSGNCITPAWPPERASSEFMEIKSVLSSKIFIVCLAAVAIFLAVTKYQQYRMQKEIEGQKQKLTQQMQNLEQKNQELADSLSYLNSSSFKERVARQQLDLKKNGEQVYNFGQAPTSSPQSPPNDAGGGQTNFQKWLNYFFASPTGS